MFNTTSARLQKLAISYKVPAWGVMVDRRRAAFQSTYDEVLVLLDKKGSYLCSVQASNHDAWKRIEHALRDYAVTEECQAEWSRYDAEGQPMIGTLGLPL